MELRLPAPCLVVLVGVSGSGKSTWAAEHFAANEIVSSDSLRAMVGAGEDDQAASTAAFDLLDQIVAARMRRGLTTVIDTLGLDKAARSRWVAIAHQAGLPAHAVLFDTPHALSRERNERRTRPVPRAVLSKQISRFNATRGSIEADLFDGIHSEQPVALVTPRIAGLVEPMRPALASGHSFGLMVSRFDWKADLGEALASIAARAEAAGFRDIWVMDHFRQIRGVGRPWEDIPEAYTTLGYIAAATRTTRLGVLVTAITHRHPILLGKMIATLDVISGGRAICGLGAGWDREEHLAYGIEFPPLRHRYALLEETLQMLPLLWGRGTPPFTGEHIRSPGLVCYPRPVQERIPILIGGGGEKRTLRLVAAYADACNLFGNPAKVAAKVAVLERHCTELDRDPADIEVTHLSTALVGADRSSLRERVEQLRDRNTPAESFGAAANAGTVDDLESLFTAYSDAGTRHSIVAMPDVALEGSIETFGDVIARFNSS